MDTLFKNRSVIDQRTDIDDAAHLNTDIRIDNGMRQDHDALSDLCSRADIGSRVDQRCKMPAGILDFAAPRQAELVVTGFSDDLFICGGPRSLRDSTIDKANRRTAEKAGLPHIRIHDFWHSHASLLCNAGVNIQEISRRLGHANVTETWRTYSHMYPSEESRVLNVLEGCGKPKDEEKSKDGDKSKNEEKSESSTTSA